MPRRDDGNFFAVSAPLGSDTDATSGSSSTLSVFAGSFADAAVAPVIIPAGTILDVPPDLTAGTITNDGTIEAPATLFGQIEASALTNDGSIVVGPDAALLVFSPVTSDFGAESTAAASGTLSSGQAYTSEGLLGSATTSPIGWTGTVTQTGGGPWIGYSGNMASEVLSIITGGTQSSAAFTNPALEAAGVPQRAVGLMVGQSAEDPSPDTAVVDTISYSFASPVPSGTSFYLWDPGADYTGTPPVSTFTFAASFDGVPVSTANWTFSVEYPFNVTTSTTYAIDAADGAVTVSNYSGNPLPDAIIVATPNTPITALSVTGDTIAYDAWGLSFAANSPQIVIQDGATLGFADSVDAGETVIFGSNATLLLDQPGSFAATLSDFAAGDTIDVAGSSVPGLDQLLYFDTATNVMAVEQADGTVFDLQFGLTESYADGFTFTSDGNGGTDIATAEPAPCFVRGTRIATPCGERQVEDLRPGMPVRLHGGGEAPVKWVGRRRVTCFDHESFPIRIAAGAFGPGCPTRDLFLSADHAIFVDGMLVPVGLLANGRTISPDPRAQVEYFHVELDAHDVLLAEGMPAESYLDTGNRRKFVNCPLVTPAPDAALPCGPMVLGGPEIDGLRARLHRHATGPAARPTPAAGAALAEPA